MTVEHRTDCEDFEPKESLFQCGDCQTDGHYLCSGCRHIAPYDRMEESDNRMKYYPKLYKKELEEQMIEDTINEFIIQGEATAEDDFYFDEDEAL